MGFDKEGEENPSLDENSGELIDNSKKQKFKS